MLGDPERDTLPQCVWDRREIGLHSRNPLTDHRSASRQQHRATAAGARNTE
jgi:hypothetical protein